MKPYQIPEHLKISDDLILKIRSGEIGVGDKIPSLSQLAERFKVDRNVARRAIARLENLGWVEPVNGKGCYVKERPQIVPSLLSKYSRYTSDMIRMGEKPNSHLLHWSLEKASAMERQFLELSDDDKVYRLEILRFAGPQPITVHSSSLPEKTVPGLEKHLDKFSSLFDLLAEHYGMNITRKFSIIETHMPLSRDAELLEISENIPIFWVESLNVNADGTPVELAVARMRGDRLQYKIEFETVQKEQMSISLDNKP